MPRITDRTSADMIEATRLTREGRLGEATAMLQGLLRGKPPASTAGCASRYTLGAYQAAAAVAPDGGCQSRRLPRATGA